MRTPHLLVLISAGRRFAHAAYAANELLARCGVRRTILAYEKGIPEHGDFDAVILYTPPQVIPPELEVPVIHMLATSFFVERFEQADCLPQPPFMGEYPSPALFVSPREFFPPRNLKNLYTVYEDFIASTYLLLSAHEERVNPQFDEHGRFHGPSSLLYRGGVLQRPLIEDYALKLAGILQSAGVKMPIRANWPGDARIAVCLTSDIDIPRRNTWRAAARAFLHNSPLFSDLPHQPSPWSYFPIGKKSDSYAEFGNLMRHGEPISAKWTFFFLAGARSKLDPYSLGEAPELAEHAKDLVANGHEIGLHSPYECLRMTECYAAAMNEFTTTTAASPVGVRQHYLRYQLPHTWRAQAEAGLQYDAGAAFAACEGFRFGTCLPFQAFDGVRGELLPLWIIPLTAMDMTLRAYQHYTPETAADRLKNLLEQTRRVGGVFTLLWHNSSVGPGWEAWEETFDMLINSLAQESIWAPTCSELLKAWRRISEP